MPPSKYLGFRAVLIAAIAAATATGTAGAITPARTSRDAGVCTMAAPSVRATVEAQVPNAADFCELVSEALAGDVFHTPVSVTLGRLWHYADASRSCRLRYGRTSSELTIDNSSGACRWFTRRAPSWHSEPEATRRREPDRSALCARAAGCSADGARRISTPPP